MYQETPFSQSMEDSLTEQRKIGSDDTIRRELWRILAQTQTIAAFNPMKKTERGRAKTFLEAAVASSKNSGDALFIGASLGHIAHFSLREEHNPVKAVHLLSHAQKYIPASHSLNGWFALVMASIAAKGGHQQECEAYLTEAMTIACHLPQTPDFHKHQILWISTLQILALQVLISSP